MAEAKSRVDMGGGDKHGEAYTTPLGPRGGEAPLQFKGEPEVTNFKVYLRLRPYFPSEVEECKKAGIDPQRSCIEFDEMNANKVSIEDPGTISVKPKPLPPKKQWKGVNFTKLLWSFSEANPRWADEVKHTYYDQEATYKAITDNEIAVRAMYNGLSQAVIVYGGTLTGKTYTALGDTSNGDASWGLAPRIVRAIFDGRKQFPKAEQKGEQKKIDIEVMILRIWKENIEDFTDPQNPQNVNLTGDMLQGVSSMRLESQRDVTEVCNRIIKLGKRKERRSHVIVHVNVRQTSTYKVDTDHHYDTSQTTEAVKASTYTIADIGSGGRHDSESQNDGRLIAKPRTAISRVFDLLRSKTETDIQNEVQDPLHDMRHTREKKEREKSWSGNGVLLGRHQKDVDRANDNAPDSAKTGKPASTSNSHAVTLPKVPYKDSRLTQILSEQLGGCCQTRIVCCVTPFHKHNVDNGLTIDFSKNALVIRSKTYVREDKELERLQKINEEKIKLSNKVFEVSENVQKVQGVLKDRQVQMNNLMTRNAQLTSMVTDREEQIEELERVRHSYSKAICAVQSLMESGPINKELQQRILDAIKEQEEIRRKMAKLRAEMLRMEVQSGERDVAEMEKELDDAREAKCDALRMVGYAVEAEAITLLKGEMDGENFHIGDTVKVRREDSWHTMTIKNQTGEQFVLTEKDHTGKTTEDTFSKEEIFSPKKKNHQVDLNATAGRYSEAEENDKATSLLMANLKQYLDNNHADGLPKFQELIRSELKFATDRLSQGGSVPASDRPKLTPLLEECNTEFVDKVKAAVQKTVPDVSQKMKDNTSGKFQGDLQKALSDSSFPLAMRITRLQEVEAKHASNTIEKDRAASKLVKGVNGNVKDAPSLDTVQNAIYIVHDTKERLAVLLDYTSLRGKMEDTLEEWLEAMSSSFVLAMQIAAEAKTVDEQAAAKEKEAKEEQELVDKEEQALKAAEGATAAKQKGVENKKKELQTAQDKCCVVM